MSAYDRWRHSARMGSRTSDGGGIRLCDGPAGADAGVEAQMIVRHSGAARRAELGIQRFRVCVARIPEMTTAIYVVNTPTIAPIRHVVSAPETIDFNPSELISS